MAIDTIEDALAEYCRRMPGFASDIRRVAQAGGVHQIIITTQGTDRRGIVTEMEEREVGKGRRRGRFLDLR